MTNREDFKWCDKYRPHTIADCILPDRLKQEFQTYVDKKEVPNLLLCGTAGVGKTTVAMALCDEVGCDYMMLNGSNETGIDVLRTKITQYASSMSLSGGRKVIIVDEADWMNANSLQPALRGAIEEFSRNCSFIFTCNYVNRLMPELHSRVPPIEFKLTKEEKPQMASKFFVRVLEILDVEDVIYDKKVVVELITKYFPDFRRTLNELQRCANRNNNVIDIRVLAKTDADLTKLAGYLREKDFPKVRAWVNDNTDNDPTRIFRRIYDVLSEILKPDSVPQIILILAKYQYQAAFSADHQINLLACLVEIMVEGNFK